MSKLKLRKRWKKQTQDDFEQRRRPSVAFTDYDIDSPRSSVSATCILLYGTAHVLCGTVLTLSDALSANTGGSWYDHSSYLEAYLILEYLFSVVGIFILQLLVIIDERRFQNLSQKQVKMEDKETGSYCKVSQRETPVKRILLFFPKERKFHKKLESVSEHTKCKEGTLEKCSTPQPTVHSQMSSVSVFRSSEEELTNQVFENHIAIQNFQPVNELSDKKISLSNTRQSNSSGSASSSGRRRKSGVSNFIPPHIEDKSEEDSTILITQAIQIGVTSPLLQTEAKPMRNETLLTNIPSSDGIYNKSTLPLHSNESTHPSLIPKEKSTFYPEEKCLVKPGEETGRLVYRDREGVNLYLRLGAVAFGFGVMIHDGFKISDQINDLCRSSLWIPKFVIHLGYIFLQTYFIFKHHRLAFNCHCTLVRLILIHLATVNVVQWLKTIVFEISENMRRQTNISTIYYNRSSDTGNQSFQNGTGDIHVTVNPIFCSGLADKLSPFLFPCAIEYSLIAGAVCYKLYQKVGVERSIPSHATSHKVHIPSPLNTNFERERSIISDGIKSSSHAHSECHRSHRGLFVGLLLVMVTMVAMGLFFFLQPNQQHALLAMTIYQMTEIFLQAITGSSCLFALYKMRVLAFRPLTEGEAFDDNLLLVGLCGTVTYNLFVLLPAVEYWNDEPLTARLYAVKSILEISQVLLQMFFIVEASRKCARTAWDVNKKPGRSWVTFLLASNLAMWIVNTFEVKRADAYHVLQRRYYQELSWNIINFISLPLIIFFRFHSTVCLSDIWIKCYKLH